MNVFEETNVEYYLIKDKNFDVALHLIEKHDANPYLLDNQNRYNNIFMMFAIELSSDDKYDFITLTISTPYKEKVAYIEKLIEVTRPPREYIHLTYDLFAACIYGNTPLRRVYFDKARDVVITADDQQLLSFKDNSYWIERFNSIVGDDDDEYLYIQSARVFNRLSTVDKTAIHTVLYKVLPWYTNEYIKYIDLLIYVLDLVTETSSSSSISITRIYSDIFQDYENFVFFNDNNNAISLEIIYNKYFKYMLNKFMQYKDLLENDDNNYHDIIVSVIHSFIYYLYDRCYYDETKRKEVENIIKSEYPINLLKKISNECILHTIFSNTTNDNDTTKAFISFLLTSTNFKHLNRRPLSFHNLTPLSLAVYKKIHINIIKLLLDKGSVITNPQIYLKYPTLNVFQNYETLQSLAAKVVANNTCGGDEKSILPKYLRDFVDVHYNAHLLLDSRGKIYRQIH